MTYWPLYPPNGVTVGPGVNATVDAGVGVFVDVAEEKGVAVKIDALDGSGVTPIVGGAIVTTVGEGELFPVHATNISETTVQSKIVLRIQFFYLSTPSFPQ